MADTEHVVKIRLREPVSFRRIRRAVKRAARPQFTQQYQGNRLLLGQASDRVHEDVMVGSQKSAGFVPGNPCQALFIEPCGWPGRKILLGSGASFGPGENEWSPAIEWQRRIAATDQFAERLRRRLRRHLAR
jgi:hypothetical protein